MPTAGFRIIYLCIRFEFYAQLAYEFWSSKVGLNFILQEARGIGSYITFLFLSAAQARLWTVPSAGYLPTAPTSRPGTQPERVRLAGSKAALLDRWDEVEDMLAVDW
jgi:hypothetical protein